MRATYRLQLRPGFGFAEAEAAIPYLAKLGITHLYLSPVLQAAEGSTHGYDVVDPERVSEALGGEAAFESLLRAAATAGLGVLLDIVPNHMSIAGTRNRWWLDVLENGPASYHAHYFDVDWSVEDHRVLLPVLGERYGRALLAGHLEIVAREPLAASEVDRPAEPYQVRAGDLRFPLSPRSLGEIVKRAGERAGHAELTFIGDSLLALPQTRAAHDDQARRRRHRDKAVLQRRLAELSHDSRCAKALADELADINGDPVALDAILEKQNYRLAHWSVARAQLGYRRFFDITTLVGVRNEDPEVFAASHGKVLGWLETGAIAGVRIDHVDGLREPTTYLKRLRAAAPQAWIVVEKILAPGEQLPRSWPIDGTTGYEFIDAMGALFTDPAGERAMTETFEEYTGQPHDPHGESRKARREVMSDALHSELVRLTELAARACAQSAACRDYTRPEIEAALGEILAGYPTYRTYLGEDGGPPGESIERERIAHAIAQACEAAPELDRDLMAFLEAALAFEMPSPEALDLARTAQQVTGPIVAKGDEDTLLYRQVRLLSRCEVGGDHATFASGPEAIHRRLATGGPLSLLASATHDTKRGEDVRARIAVLSELPGEWREAVTRWRARAERYWDDTAPDRVFEYALWQTLVGAWPISLDRVRQWAEKATREARLRTSWRQPDAAYDAARDRWLERIYADRELQGDLERFVTRIAPPGDRNSLAQTLIKLAAPGVPDFYQGCELRDDSLVDPDNRRPVDLALRERMLHELTSTPPAELGPQKLWLISRVLAARAAADGPYEPLVAMGPHADRVFAFTRGSLIAVVPRLGVRAETWRDTTLELPVGTWRDVLSEREYVGAVRLADLWQTFSVACLVRT